MALRMRSMLLPRALDDAGAMCAALIKAELAGLGDKKLRPWIDNYLNYVSSGQFRFEDGTLARNRPLPNSLWLDDLYMSVPCLAQAGKLTGDRRYYDDAAKQILQFADRMFVQGQGPLHARLGGRHGTPSGVSLGARQRLGAHGHGRVARGAAGRSSGPARASWTLYREHAAGPRRRAGPRGTVAPVSRPAASPTRRPRRARCSCSRSRTASIAAGSTAWRSGPRCHSAGTRWREGERERAGGGHLRGHRRGLGSDVYMYRPVHVLAAHGYGPVLLAGAEMIELRRATRTSACTTAGCSSASRWRTSSTRLRVRGFGGELEICLRRTG